MIKLKWWNTCDLQLEDGSGVVFTNSSGGYNDFYLEIWLQPLTDIGYPKYEIDQEATEDGNNQQQITFQKWDKRYSMTLMADEPFLDGITIIPLCDNIWITNDVTGDEYKIRDVVFSEPNWNEGLATITMEWSVMSMIRGNCCNQVPLECEEDCSFVIDKLQYVSDCDFSIQIGSNTCTQGWCKIYYAKPGDLPNYTFWGTKTISELQSSQTITIDESPCPDGEWGFKVVIGNHSCDAHLSQGTVTKS